MNKISVVLCTFNRLAYLRGCITSLLALDFPDYEIIIVNDGSSDGTKEYLDNLGHENVKIIHHQENMGSGAARNSGIKIASGEIIAFTDDDCQVEKNWLAGLSNTFADLQTGFVIGQVYYRNKNYKGYFPERLVANPAARWPMGCNIAYRKEVFETAGGFDNFFSRYSNEDTEMAIRAISLGFRFSRSLDAAVIHQAIEWTAGSLLRSARNASVWPILKQKYPVHFSHFGPPVRFGCIINMEEYLYLLASPVLIPLLLIRFLINRKRDLKIFFAKWPIFLILKRFYIFKEAVKNKKLMV